MAEIQTDCELSGWQAEPRLNEKAGDSIVAEGNVRGHYYHLVERPVNTVPSCKFTILQLTIDGFNMYSSENLSEDQMKARIARMEETGQISWPGGCGSIDLDQYISELIEHTAAEEDMVASHLGEMRGEQRAATIDFLESRGRTDLLEMQTSSDSAAE